MLSYRVGPMANSKIISKLLWLGSFIVLDLEQSCVQITHAFQSDSNPNSDPGRPGLIRKVKSTPKRDPSTVSSSTSNNINPQSQNNTLNSASLISSLNSSSSNHALNNAHFLSNAANPLPHLGPIANGLEVIPSRPDGRKHKHCPNCQRRFLTPVYNNTCPGCDGEVADGWPGCYCIGEENLAQPQTPANFTPPSRNTNSTDVNSTSLRQSTIKESDSSSFRVSTEQLLSSLSLSASAAPSPIPGMSSVAPNGRLTAIPEIAPFPNIDNIKNLSASGSAAVTSKSDPTPMVVDDDESSKATTAESKSSPESDSSDSRFGSKKSNLIAKYDKSSDSTKPSSSGGNIFTRAASRAYNALPSRRDAYNALPSIRSLNPFASRSAKKDDDSTNLPSSSPASGVSGYARDDTVTSNDKPQTLADILLYEGADSKILKNMIYKDEDSKTNKVTVLFNNIEWNRNRISKAEFDIRMSNLLTTLETDTQRFDSEESQNAALARFAKLKKLMKERQMMSSLFYHNNNGSSEVVNVVERSFFQSVLEGCMDRKMEREFYMKEIFSDSEFNHDLLIDKLVGYVDFNKSSSIVKQTIQVPDKHNPGETIEKIKTYVEVEIHGLNDPLVKSKLNGEKAIYTRWIELNRLEIPGIKNYNMSLHLKEEDAGPEEFDDKEKNVLRARLKKAMADNGLTHWPFANASEDSLETNSKAPTKTFYNAQKVGKQGYNAMMKWINILKDKTGIIKDIDGFCSGSDAKSLIGAEADNAYNNLGSVERTIYDFFFLKFCYKKQSFDKDLEKYRQKLAAKIRSDYYKSGPERSGASSRRAHNLMYAKNEGDKSSFKSLGIDDFSNRSGTSGKLEAKDLLQYLYSEQMPGIIGEFQIPLIKLAQELYFFARGYNLKVSALKVAKVNGPRLSSSSSDETIMSIINAANYSQRIRLEIDEYIRMREAERMKNLKEKEEKDLEELAHTKLDEIDINDPEGRMRAQKAKTIYKEKMKKEEKEKNELAKQMGNMNLNGNAEVGDGVNSESDSDSESDDKKSETVPAAAVIERQANVPLSLLKDPSKRFTEEFQNADPLRTDFLKKRSVEEIERKKNLKIEEVLKDLEEKEDSRFDRTIVANWDLYDYLRNGLKMLRSGDLENTTQLEIVVDNYFPVIKSRLKSAEYFNQFVNSNDISAQIEGKNWARNMNPSFFRNKIGAGENGVGMINNENSINSQQNHQVAVNAEYEQKFANIAQHSFLISAQDEVEDDVILQERTRLKNIERRKNESSIFLNLNPSQITTEGIFRLFKLARTPYDDSIMKMYQTLFNIETGSTVSGGPNVVGVGHSSNNSNTVTNFNTDAKNKFDSIFDNSGEPKKAFSKKYPKTYHRDVRLFFELMRKDIVMPILGLQNPVFTRKELKEKFDKIQKVWDPFYNKSDKDDTFCKVPETERIPVRVLKYQVIHDVQTIPNDPNHVNVFYRDINLCGKIWDLANKVKIIAERLIGDLDLDYDYFIKFDSRSPTNLAPHNNINGTTEAQYRLLRRYQKLSHYHRMYLYSTKTVVAKMEQMNALTSDDFESIVNFETEFEREETEANRALEFVSIALGLPRGYTTEDIEYFKEQFQNFNIVENKDIIWQPLLVREDVGGKLNSINKLNDPTYRCVFSVEADGEGIEGVNKIVSFEDFISIKDSAIEIAEKYVNTKWNKTITGKKNNNRISNSSNSSSDKSNNVQLFSGKGYTLGTDVETQLMIDGMNGINLGVNNNNNDPNRANHNDPMPMSPMTPNNEELIADNGFLLPTSIPEVLASHIESIFAPIRQEVSDALKELSKRILKHMRGPGGIDYSKYLGVSDDTDISGIHLWHARSSDNERLGLSDTNSDADSHYTVTGKMYTISDLPQLQAYAMGYSQAELLSMKKRRDKERTIRYSVCPGGGNTDLLMGIPKRLEAWATNDDPANDNIMPWYMNQSGYVNNLINSGDNHPLFTKAYLSSTIFLQHLEANLIKTLYRELVEIPEKKSLYRSEMKSSLLRFVPKNVYYAQPPFRNWASDMRNAENCMRDAATDSNKKKAESSITAEERIYLSKAEEKRNRNAEGRQDDTIIVGPAMVDGFSLHADKPQWFVSKNEYQQWIADNVKGICEEIIEMYQETVYIETVVTVRGTENQIKHKKASTNEDKAIYGDKYPMWAVVLWRMESNLRIKVLEKLKEWWNLKTQQNQNQHQSENQPDINNGPSRPLARPKQKKKPKRTAAESGSVPMDVDSESHTGAVPMDVTSGATVTSASSSSNANGTNTRSSANKDWNYLEIQSQLTELNDKNYISSSPDDCFHYVKIINLLPDEHTTTRFKQMCMDPADPKNRSSSSSSTATGPGGADPSSSNFIQGATGELVLYKKDLLLASFIWIQSFIVHALDTDAYNQLPNPKISAAAITTRDNDLHNSGNTNLLFAKIWKTGSAVCVGLAVFLHEVAKDLGYVESYIAEGFPKITSEIAMGTDVVFRNHQEIKGNPELALVHINEANHVWVEIRMDPITKEPYGTDDFSLARVNMSSEAKFRVTGGDTSGWFIFDCNWNKASDAINSSVPFFGIPAYMVRDMFYLKQGGHTGDYGSERKAYYTEKTPNQDPLQIVPAWNPAYSKDIFRTRPCLMPWFYELQRRYKFQFHGSFIDYKDYQQNMIYHKDATTFILPRKNTTPKFYGTEFPSPTTNPTVDSDNINNATNVFNGSANVTSFEDTKFGKAFHSHYKLLGDKDSQWISSGTGLYSPDGPSEGALYGSDPIWGQNYGYSFATATSSSAADGTTNIEKSKPRSIPDRPEWGNRFFIDGVDRNLKRTLLFSSRGMKQPSRVSASARCWAETQMDKEKNKFEKYLGDSTVVTLDLRKIDEEMRHELGSNIDSIPDKIKIDKSTDLNIYQLHLDFAKTIDYYDKYKQVINRCILDIQAEALEDQFALKGRAAIMQMIVRFSN